MKRSKYKRLEEQLPSVSSEASHNSHSFHRSDTNDVEEPLATHENKQRIKEVGGETKINTFIKVPYQYKPYACICCRSRRCIHSQMYKFGSLMY